MSLPNSGARIISVSPSELPVKEKHVAGWSLSNHPLRVVKIVVDHGSRTISKLCFPSKTVRVFLDNEIRNSKAAFEYQLEEASSALHARVDGVRVSGNDAGSICTWLAESGKQLESRGSDPNGAFFENVLPLRQSMFVVCSRENELFFFARSRPIQRGVPH